MDADAKWMQRAIETARRGIAAGQSPFGAVVARGEELVAEAHNAVIAETDPTSHAEVRAIRAASRALATIDLTECVLYSTCEPCPMCFGAIHWARLHRLVFGARIEDALAAGFNELGVSNETLRSLGGSGVAIVPDCHRAACVELFAEWARGPAPRRY
jgi:tRNA(Arg) A34 adenosine deaminase TadA